MSTFEALEQVRKQHARSQRDRVPKTAPEAVRARAHARVAKLEKQRGKLYTAPDGLGPRAASRLQGASADYTAGKAQSQRGLRLTQKRLVCHDGRATRYDDRRIAPGGAAGQAPC